MKNHSVYNSDLNDKGFKVINEDCFKVLENYSGKFDLIFVDPPYLLSNNGVTCQSGEMVSVNKGDWDESKGFTNDINYTEKWMRLCAEVLKENGSIWITGTSHIIYKIGYLLEKLNFKIINDIIWFKPNAPPNLSCNYFTHSHEILLWAKKNNEKKHQFNYKLMKNWNDKRDKIKNPNKQMRSVWWIPAISNKEKSYGFHPTQKPLELLNRVISSSSQEGDIILDPFCGTGTTGIVANKLNRKFLGIEINNEYVQIAKRRMKNIDKVHIYRPIKNEINLSQFM